MAFREVASIYLDDAERRFANKTYKYKAYVYRSFLEYHGNIPINEVTPQMVHNYLNTRPSNNNYNVHRKDLSALFVFAQKRLKLIKYNPCWDIEKVPHTPARKVIPTEEQVLKIISSATLEEERPLILVILHTTARVDEILRLKWKDVDFNKKIVTRWTRKRKGGIYEPIETPMNHDLFEVLWTLWKGRKQDIWVFYNDKTETRYNHRPKLMKTLCKRAGIEPAFGFHALRHFMSSYMADSNKVSKKTISEFLGHKSLETTERYLHAIDDSKRLAVRAVEGKFVLAGSACGNDKN
jgi:integrase